MRVLFRRFRGIVLILAVAAGSIAWSTRLDDPPRYDGAGYALLGRALAEGRGYRDISHPDAPRHSHFPPGYPAALGLIWKVQGRASVATAHLFSVGCSLIAVGATWRWWRGSEPRGAAFLLGLALAINWGWGRSGGAIQSEPMFLALGGITLLLASRGGLALTNGRQLVEARLTVNRSIDPDHPPSPLAGEGWGQGSVAFPETSSPPENPSDCQAIRTLSPALPRQGGGGLFSGGLKEIERSRIERCRLDRGLALGVVLGVCVLTRHVGACLALAVGIDLWLRGRRASVGWALLVLVGMVAPWVAWQAWVGSGTQAELFRVGSIPGLVVSQVIFYVQRIPDAMTGPFVEAATVFGRSRVVGWLAGAWAVGASLVIFMGWGRMLRTSKRRLGAMIPMATLGLLLVWPFTEAGRFLVPLVPFLLMGAVEGLAPFLRASRIHRARTWAAGLVLVASLPYSVYALVSDRSGAQRRTHADFEAACQWIADQTGHPGPILARHSGDVFWLTSRQALTIPEADAIARTIDQFGVAYLLVDEDRYVNAPANPLRAYLANPSNRARMVWKGRGALEVYEVTRLGEGSP